MINAEIMSYLNRFQLDGIPLTGELIRSETFHRPWTTSEFSPLVADCSADKADIPGDVKNMDASRGANPR